MLVHQRVYRHVWTVGNISIPFPGSSLSIARQTAAISCTTFGSVTTAVYVGTWDRWCIYIYVYMVYYNMAILAIV